MQKTVQRMMSRSLCLAVLAGVLFLAVGCSEGGAGGPPPEAAVEVVIGTAERMQVEEALTAVGTLEANERVEVKPEAPGRVTAVGFSEGQRVSQGQMLFELDSSKESAAVVQAQAELDLARSNLDRAQTLVGTKAISQQEVDRLASEAAVKSAALEVQKENLAERVLLAPFEGVAGPRLVSPGQYVNAGTLLGTLVDSHFVKVRCGIPERGLAHVKTGQKGRIRVNTYPDRKFEGELELISPELDETTRTAEVRLRVPNPEGLLRPGMFARVEIIVETRENALVVPEGALVPSMDGFSVYVVREDRAYLQEVQLGVRMPGKVEIAGGLTADQPVVTSGTQKLVDGMLVAGGAAAEAAPQTGEKGP